MNEMLYRYCSLGSAAEDSQTTAVTLCCELCCELCVFSLIVDALPDLNGAKKEEAAEENRSYESPSSGVTSER